jgi:hypothetical protein
MVTVTEAILIVEMIAEVMIVVEIISEIAATEIVLTAAITAAEKLITTSIFVFTKKIKNPVSENWRGFFVGRNLNIPN